MSDLPLTVGLLVDHPTAGGAAFTAVVRRAFADVRLSGRLRHELHLVEEQADGLPQGSAAAVEAAFARLRAQQAIAVIGPAITDNALVVRDLAEAARLPCVNWTGGERTRGEWMFHYQVGSLEEEPGFLALHLAAERVRRVAVVGDDSIVGRRYQEFFASAAPRCGLDTAEFVVLPQDGRDELDPVVERLRAAAPDAVLYLGLWSCAHALAVALSRAAWRPRVLVANSALMYGHASAAWARAWQGWRYVDAYSESNPVLRELVQRVGPGVAAVTAAAAYDMGRLVAEGIAAATDPDGPAVKLGLERVKQIPAALGADGTTMGFGVWERAALKGRYLVLREWRDGASLEVVA
jgi:ABC-type branched-subunit amino acid transport system substrate-binding protein